MGQFFETANEMVTLLIGVGTVFTTFGTIFAGFAAERGRRKITETSALIGAMIGSDVEDAFLTLLSELANLRIDGVTVSTQAEQFVRVAASTKFLRQGMRSVSLAIEDGGKARRAVGKFWRLYDRYFDAVSIRKKDSDKLGDQLMEVIESGKTAYEALFQKFDDDLTKTWNAMKADKTTRIEFSQRVCSKIFSSLSRPIVGPEQIGRE